MIWSCPYIPKGQIPSRPAQMKSCQAVFLLFSHFWLAKEVIIGLRSLLGVKLGNVTIDSKANLFWKLTLGDCHLIELTLVRVDSPRFSMDIWICCLECLIMSYELAPGT